MGATVGKVLFEVVLWKLGVQIAGRCSSEGALGCLKSLALAICFTEFSSCLFFVSHLFRSYFSPKGHWNFKNRFEWNVLQKKLLVLSSSFPNIHPFLSAEALKRALRPTLREEEQKYLEDEAVMATWHQPSGHGSKRLKQGPWGLGYFANMFFYLEMKFFFWGTLV